MITLKERFIVDENGQRVGVLLAVAIAVSAVPGLDEPVEAPGRVHPVGRLLDQLLHRDRAVGARRVVVEVARGVVHGMRSIRAIGARPPSARGCAGVSCVLHQHAAKNRTAGKFDSARSGDRITNMNDCCLKFIDVGTAPYRRSIAVRSRPGNAPGLFWLGGFNSDMRGTKVEALDGWAA